MLKTAIALNITTFRFKKILIFSFLKKIYTRASIQTKASVLDVEIIMECKKKIIMQKIIKLELFDILYLSIKINTIINKGDMLIWNLSVPLNKGLIISAKKYKAAKSKKSNIQIR